MSIEATVKLPHEVIVVAVAGDEPTLAALRKTPAKTIIQPDCGGAVQAMNLALGSEETRGLVAGGIFPC